MIHKTEKESTNIEPIARQGVHHSIEAFREINSITQQSTHFNEVEPQYLPIPDEDLVKAFTWFADSTLDTDSPEYEQATKLLQTLSESNLPILLVFINTNDGEGPLQPMLIPYIGRLTKSEKDDNMIGYDHQLDIEYPITPGEIRSRAMTQTINGIRDTASNTVVFSTNPHNNDLNGHRLHSIDYAIRYSKNEMCTKLLTGLNPLYEEIYKIAPLQNL